MPLRVELAAFLESPMLCVTGDTKVCEAAFHIGRMLRNLWLTSFGPESGSDRRGALPPAYAPHPARRSRACFLRLASGQASHTNSSAEGPPHALNKTRVLTLSVSAAPLPLD